MRVLREYEVTLRKEEYGTAFVIAASVEDAQAEAEMLADDGSLDWYGGEVWIENVEER